MFQYFKKFGDKPCCFTDLKVFVDLLPAAQCTQVRVPQSCQCPRCLCLHASAGGGGPVTALQPQCWCGHVLYASSGTSRDPRLDIPPVHRSFFIFLRWITWPRVLRSPPSNIGIRCEPLHLLTPHLEAEQSKVKLLWLFCGCVFTRWRAIHGRAMHMRAMHRSPLDQCFLTL